MIPAPAFHPYSAANSSGLTEDDAAAKLQLDGPNELAVEERYSRVWIALRAAREPVFLLLVVTGGIYFLLGEPAEALLLLGFVILAVAITVSQEAKAERALESLRSLSSPRALVLRNDRLRRIAGREVVRGDLLVLSEGDRVAADCELVGPGPLLLDESLLTGESAPVTKADPGARIFAGSSVVKGNGSARVVETGVRTRMGQLGRALSESKVEPTLLQQEIRTRIRYLAASGLTFCILVVILYGITRGTWLEGALAGITLAMAILPNEVPAVLAVFLALGAWRLSREKVLARRVPVVEALGAATVLCVDKTGTLTQNRMSLRRVWAQGSVFDIHDENTGLDVKVKEVLDVARKASRRLPVDPMEAALKRAIEVRLVSETTGALPKVIRAELIREYPLKSDLLVFTRVWRPGNGACEVAAKGAPEAIADVCHLPPEAQAEVREATIRFARDGLRVLGVADARCDAARVPSKTHDFDFRLVGLVAFEDPLRPEVPESVRICRSAGVRLVMLTGDFPDTARAIAREAGFEEPLKIGTGEELASWSDADLRSKVGAISIFARVYPEQKLRLVRALQANGEIVVMTGDGVNDAPALKAADIGIAMGARGTDVAREAASLVLLNDDFGSIVKAIHRGRQVFENLRHAMVYLFAVHVPIVGLSLVPIALGMPLVLLPAHVAFLHLVIEPACSVVFEAENGDPQLMATSPRPRSQGLFDKTTVGLGLKLGLGVLAVAVGVLLLALRSGRPIEEARALAFTTLIFANLALIYANLSWKRSIADVFRHSSRALMIVSSSAVLFLALVLSIRGLRELFGFSRPRGSDIAISVLVGLVSVAWFEWIKARGKR